MIVLNWFLASTLWAAAQISSREEKPTVGDLEQALRGTSGEQFGASGTDSPHEMLLRMDVRDVPDDLLIGVLLSGAVRGDPVDGARRLLGEAGGDLTRLLDPHVWDRTEGVGTVGRARVVAATEMSRRLDVRDAFKKRAVITDPEKAEAYLRSMSLGPDETLSVLFLDRRRRVISGRVLTKGSDRFTVVDPPQVFREAVASGASAIILAHNHPSGDASPSSQDDDVTERVARVGRVIGIPLVDHIVLGGGGRYISYAEQGRLPSSYSPPGKTWTAEP